MNEDTKDRHREEIAFNEDIRNNPHIGNKPEQKKKITIRKIRLIEK